MEAEDEDMGVEGVRAEWTGRDPTAAVSVPVAVAEPADLPIALPSLIRSISCCTCSIVWYRSAGRFAIILDTSRSSAGGRPAIEEVCVTLGIASV